MRKRIQLFLEDELVVIVAAVLAFAFLATGRVAAVRVPQLVDWPLLLVLFALLVAVELIRDSNLLDVDVIRFVARFRSVRSFTVAMVLVTGALSAVVTNDVTLFVVIPFTVVAGRYGGVDVRNAVVLEIIAANVLGCLTPLGNPQNLFLHHRAGWSATHFALTMLPFVVWSAAGLLAAVMIATPAKELEPRPWPVATIDRVRAAGGVLCLALVLLEIAHVLPAWPAALAAAILTPFLLRSRWSEMDLSIVSLFFFVFIVVEGLRTLPVYALFARLPDEPHGLALYSGAILSSQVISNVPTAVLFAPLAEGQWRTLLYAVNAGGCGTVIASLANLLGWQIYLRESGSDRTFIKVLTIASFLFLIWIGIGAWLILMSWPA
jgi:Na+/H+ antiporter NhaD/arsenite permease-like protein